MQDRATKLLGLVSTTAQQADEKYAWEVQYLYSTEDCITFTDTSLLRGIAESMTKAAGSPASYGFSVADLGCGCAANGRQLCKHVEAAARRQPLTMDVLQAAAAHIAERAEGELFWSQPSHRAVVPNVL